MSYKIGIPSTAMHQKIDGRNDEVKDAVIVGDGISGKFAAANMMHRMQKQSDRQPEFARQNFEILMIGDGDGRAYTKDRGHSGIEKVNLMRNEMSHRPGNIVPFDENFMTHNTLELEFRANENRRPYDLRTPFEREGARTAYSLVKERDTSLTLQKFVQAFYPEKADDIETERHILNAYSNYVVNEELARTDNLAFGKVAGSVRKIDYDPAEKIFTLEFHAAPGEPPSTIKARHVVLATGLEADVVPPCLRDLVGKPGIYIGEEIFGRFMQQLDQACPGNIDDAAFYQRLDALKKGQALLDPDNLSAPHLAWYEKKGLVIGSGLTMDDAVSKLITKGLSNFDVVSRHALTHELPMQAPVLAELEDEALEITDLLDASNFLSGTPEERVKKIKAALLEARDLAQTYELVEDQPLEIRGQDLSRTKVSRALLAQFAVFSYEKLRGELRNRIGNEHVSNPIAAQLLKEIDRDPDLASWITTSRTSTTVRNIVLHDALRQTGRLQAAEIEKVEPVGDRYQVFFARPADQVMDGKTYFEMSDKDAIEKSEICGDRIHVTFKKPESRIVDYVLNCAGRSYGVQEPWSEGERNSELTNYLFNNGLFQSHPVGVGVAMDEAGRSRPDRQKIPGSSPVELYLAAPFSAKGDQYMPANHKRHPLSNTVGESVLGLRPLIQQVSKALVYNLAKWWPEEGVVEYVYDRLGAVRRSELDDYDSDDGEFDNYGDSEPEEEEEEEFDGHDLSYRPGLTENSVTGGGPGTGRS